MSLAIVHTRAALGVNAPPITIEVHISNGLPGWPTGNHGKRGA